MLLRFAELPSTNDEVMRRASEGAGEGLWVLTDVQTRGRGRQGRDWSNAQGGNFFGSTLIRVQRDDPPAQTLAFVAGVAAREALAKHAPATALKWPNDLLIDGRKLAGILLERRDETIVAGFGINLASHPSDTETPATDLRSAIGVTIAPELFCETLAESLSAWLIRWRGQGFAPVREAWLANCTGLGQRIRARLPQETLTGLFSDIASDGALILQLDNGSQRVVHAADVFGL